MNKTLIIALTLSLVATSCLAISKKRNPVITVLTEYTSADNYSIQELLDFPVQTSISCSDVNNYQDIKDRMKRFISFLNDNPVDSLQQAISSLSQASLLLKKARSNFKKLKQLEDEAAENYSLVQKNKQADIQENLNQVDNIINPQLFQKIFSSIDSSQSLSVDEAIQKLEQATELISQLKNQYQSFLNEQDSFGAYSSQLSQQVEKLDAAINMCEA